MVYGKTTINTIQAVKFSDSKNIQIGMLVKFSMFDKKEILGRIYSIWTRNRLLESEDSLPNLSVKDLNAVCNTPFIANNSVDLGNNTNWNIETTSGIADYNKFRNTTSCTQVFYISSSTGHRPNLLLGSHNNMVLANATNPILTFKGANEFPGFYQGITEKLLGREVVLMQDGDAKTTVYTGTTGMKYIVTKVVIRNPTDDLADGVDFDFGDGANADTWKTTVDLSGMANATDYMVITNNNAIITVFDAGDAFGIKPATGATADAEAIMEVWGYEIPGIEA